MEQNQQTGFAIEVMLNNTTLVHREDFNTASGHVAIDLSFTLQQNDQLTIVLDNFEGDDGGYVEMSNLKMRLFGQPAVKVPVGYGDTLRMNSFIPKNIKQKDLLASIIKMFNLFLDESKDRVNHLKIEPYGTYYKKTVTKDWSAKLDRNTTYRLKPVAELASRKYEFKYKDDNDFWNDYYKRRFNESYGSRVHDTGNEFVKDKQTLELIFSPTPLVGYEGTDRILPAIYKRDGINDKPTNFNVRILLRAAAPIDCQAWSIKLPTGSSTTFTKYPYVGHLDNPDAPNYDINFGSPKEYYFRLVTAYLSANLFNVYWSWYMSEVSDKDSKMFTGKFYLTPEDIADLDFSELIFIDGMIYRLHKVIDYTTNGEETTACELLTVIDKD
ncbi:MAG: hypothetical protein EOO38_11240 [Cytophagaceae bacterium]|nr:MAG: hypothetical protein EOO38_11240 [Cytophagaceae bacterium]